MVKTVVPSRCLFRRLEETLELGLMPIRLCVPQITSIGDAISAKKLLFRSVRRMLSLRFAKGSFSGFQTTIDAPLILRRPAAN